MLKIITVGYNEAGNLPYLYSSLKILEDGEINVKKIYIDQSSTDHSVNVAKDVGCDIYIHENKGYADPDKKRAVETLCKDDDWIMILDADEVMSDTLANEIKSIITENIYEVGNVKIVINILGGVGQVVYQPRLFKKPGVVISDAIHTYLKVCSDKIIKLNGSIENIDRKTLGNEIFYYTNKNNTYTEQEVEKYMHLSQGVIVRQMFRKPLQWFFGRGIMHKQFLRGIRGIMICTSMAYYQWLIYAKVYEKKYVK